MGSDVIANAPMKLEVERHHERAEARATQCRRLFHGISGCISFRQSRSPSCSCVGREAFRTLFSMGTTRLRFCGSPAKSAPRDVPIGENRLYLYPAGCAAVACSTPR